MKKNLAAIVSSLIVLGSVNPVFAAVKNVYTDADSGFSMQTADPHFEYASRNSYGFQEAKSATNTINSVAAVPADIVAKKTGRPFTTKEFMEKLAIQMNSKANGKPDYDLFQPETYAASNQLKTSLDEGLFQVFGEAELQDAAFSYSTKTVGSRSYFVITMKYPGAYDGEKNINKNASDIQLNITSENNILYLVESYCSAENEGAVQMNKDKAGDNSKVDEKKDSKISLSAETAQKAVQNPEALHKALIPLAASSLNDPKLQKSLKKEREALLKNLVIFKPTAAKKGFGIEETLLRQHISLPDQWMYLKIVPDMDKDEPRINVTAAAPYSMITDIAAMISEIDSGKEWKPDDLYSMYEESLLLFTLKTPKRGKAFSGQELDEMFKVPQSEMQKILDQLMTELLKREELKKYAVFSGPKAKVTNDGQLIKLAIDSNIKVMNKYDFIAQGRFMTTNEKAAASLYIAKGSKTKTKSAATIIEGIKLLPEK